MGGTVQIQICSNPRAVFLIPWSESRQALAHWNSGIRASTTPVDGNPISVIEASGSRVTMFRKERRAARYRGGERLARGKVTVSFDSLLALIAVEGLFVEEWLATIALQ